MKSASENLSAQESLDIITQMINQAKGNVRQNSFYFLLWGWVVVIANLGMYTLIQVEYAYPFAVWAITIPAWVLSMYRGYQQGKSSRASTHLDRLSAGLWISFGIAVFTLVFFGYKINYQLNAVILLVSAVPTIVSGLIIRFRPLVLGGISFWAFGIGCFLVPNTYQFLLGALAVIVGYLIPGYMLKKSNQE